MISRKNSIICGICIWTLFEIYVNIRDNNKLKDKIKKLFEKNNNFFIDNINFSFFSIELLKSKSSEKLHLLNSFNKTFYDKNLNNMNDVLHSLRCYRNIRSSNNNYSEIIKYTNENMLWYPYAIRLYFTFCNDCYLLYKSMYYEVKEEYINNTTIISIKNRSKEKNKTVILFLGLGGIIFQLKNVIDFFLKKNYNIIIPLFGPAQGTTKYNLDEHESDYYDNLYNYIQEDNIKNVTIISWSLGGLLYKGFYNYLKMETSNNIKINDIFLIEPLINFRASMETFFSHIRPYRTTITIMNSITEDKYKIHNSIFSYFIHSLVGFGTLHSLGHYNNIETKNSDDYIKNRYLFISKNDLIINDVLDKRYLNIKFDDKKIFKRCGYHGGWPKSKLLIPILDTIVK